MRISDWSSDVCSSDLVQTESQGFEWAINVNGLGRKIVPTSREQAVALARHYIGKGHSVDLGLGQINSRNMKALGLTWDNVFDLCTYIAAAGAVFPGNYHSVRAGLHPPHALRMDRKSTRRNSNH